MLDEQWASLVFPAQQPWPCAQGAASVSALEQGRSIPLSKPDRLVFFPCLLLSPSPKNLKGRPPRRAPRRPRSGQGTPTFADPAPVLGDAAGEAGPRPHLQKPRELLASWLWTHVCSRGEKGPEDLPDPFDKYMLSTYCGVTTTDKKPCSCGAATPPGRASSEPKTQVTFEWIAG